MRALLDPQTAQRLAKLCGMFGSTFAGERAAAAARADSLVRSLGLTWFDVIAPRSPSPPPPPPVDDWECMVEFCNDHAALLRPREREFIESMLWWRGEPTERQLCWLTDLYRDLQRRTRR
jgi:hypothetical protein